MGFSGGQRIRNIFGNGGDGALGDLGGLSAEDIEFLNRINAMLDPDRERGDPQAISAMASQVERQAQLFGVDRNSMLTYLEGEELGTLTRSDLRASGAGRTQFASEAAVEFAQADYYRAQIANMAVEGARLEREQRETERDNAYERARNRIALLQTTESLLDERRQGATNALISALPYAVAPGTQYAPGLEPGGPAAALSQLVGANYTAPRLPTADIAFGQLANQPGAQTPESINQALLPLLQG